MEFAPALREHFFYGNSSEKRHSIDDTPNCFQFPNFLLQIYRRKVNLFIGFREYPINYK